MTKTALLVRTLAAAGALGAGGYGVKTVIINDVPPGYAATFHYASDSANRPRPGTDTVTVCAMLTDQAGVKHIGDPAVVIRIDREDDASILTGIVGSCLFVAGREGFFNAVVPTLRVGWSLLPMPVDSGGREVLRPIAWVP